MDPRMKQAVQELESASPPPPLTARFASTAGYHCLCAQEMSNVATTRAHDRLAEKREFFIHLIHTRQYDALGEFLQDLVNEENMAWRQHAHDLKSLADTPIQELCEKQG